MKNSFLQTILVISLAINVSFFVYLSKVEKDIQALNQFYSTRKTQLTNNANEYNEEAKLKAEEKVLALKKGIVDLGSVKMQMEKESFFTILNYRDFYKNIYTTIDKNKLLNENVSEWMRELGTSLYVSVDKDGNIQNGIPSSLGKNFCDSKQMAFCYMFSDDSLSAPKYEYRVVPGMGDRITKDVVRKLIDNRDKYNTMRDLYASFENIKVQDKKSNGRGLY